MAKGGNNQRSNGSRFVKPYDASNSFVKKVALRVSDYIGGLFGSSMKADESTTRHNTPLRGAKEATISHSHYESTDSGKSIGMPRCFDDFDVNDSPGKRLKIGTKRKYVPISPIANASSLFQSSVNHNFDIQNSESTSGCSSLVPQSDRLSQSAFVSSSRKKILEEKLQYARQLKQTRASMYLNRSIPVVNDTTGNRRKPSFDVSVYGSPIFDKSSVREKMVNSPFYTGQTSYGGASAYRRARTALYSQQSGKGAFERKDGLQIQVKPSHHGSTEDLSNMSHTAKRILEALEQFSTPISDAKRIPVSARSPPLSRKRKRFGDSLESISTLSSTKGSSDQVKGPLISGLNIPTVPDLLKLKRLEKIQDSTAAARQVAVQKQEYSLPTDVEPSKHTGKIVTKSKDKDKPFERPQEVNLPKIPLPISTLPKFDFKLPPIAVPTADSSTAPKPVKTISTNNLPNTQLSESNKTFKFSPPISLSAPENVKNFTQKSNFTFSTPLKADGNRDKSENAVLSNLSNFMSAEALSKLKRKSTPLEKSNSSFGLEPAKELKSGSVMDLLRKTLENNKKPENESVTENLKPLNDTWECDSCLLRNLKGSKSCSGCKAPKSSVSAEKNIKPSTESNPMTIAPSTDSKPATVTSGFGNKFKPPSDSWSCKECFVNNNSTAIKCIACENPRPQANPVKETTPAPQVKPPPVATSGFGDLFKKKTGQWECSVCLIQNKENDTKCAACETPKPGAKADKPEPPKFTFGIPPEAGGFKFGIDKADTKSETKITELPKPVAAQSNGPHSELTNKPFSSVTTSFGVYTFGIPQGSIPEKEKEPEVKADVPKVAEVEKAPTVESKPESGVVTSESSVKTTEIKEDAAPKPAESTADPKQADSPKSTPSTVNNLMAKPFSFGTQDKSMPTSLFSFGSQNSSAKSQTTTESSTSVNSTFGSGFKTLENVTSSTGFSFGQSNPVASQFTLSSTSGSNELNKTASFSQFTFSGKVEAPAATTNTSTATTTKSAEKIPEPAATCAATTTTTTNTLFGSSMFKGSKPVVNFGAATSESGGATTFGDGAKPSNTSEATSITTAAFSMTTPIFSAASSVFNGPSVPAATSTFGSITSAATATPFTASTSQGLNSDQGFRPAANPSFTSSVPTFGNPAPQVSGFGIFNTPPASNFGSGTASFGTNPTPAPTFGSPFGQPATSTEKTATPFVFGDANKASTSAPAAPTTAPNVFTFGAPKPESKPPQFSGGFGQSTFTFGSPNPAQSNVFGNFNQPKTASPFGNTNSTFASPFGQNSAPATFGRTTQKFEFGSSSQQAQSTPQPFQFGASTPQTQGPLLRRQQPSIFPFLRRSTLPEDRLPLLLVLLRRILTGKSSKLLGERSGKTLLTSLRE
ncbi:UNVERIFIED_CONTAM: hypothetical protein PYX00_001700 [Menopon gallinae]|uniref:Nuclear pore complex protein Nup153 n=1 Tax=Menopon gallinae TaxID=328185 RepID=A0AAW2IF67_9NEOP